MGGRHVGCATCGPLRDYEQAVQHVQAQETDTPHLPEAFGRLRSLPGFRGGPDLMRCPTCGTWYLYESAYEFLIGFGGSYDEQTLTRLSDREAIGYLEGETGHARETGTTGTSPGPDEDAAARAAIVYATRMAEAYFARAGRDFPLRGQPTSSWFLFGLDLHGALIPHADVLSDPGYLAFLRELFADLFDFWMIACAGNPAPQMAELYRAFGSGIRCGPILPLLLPERARPQLEAVDAILEAQNEEDRRRQDQMGY